MKNMTFKPWFNYTTKELKTKERIKFRKANTRAVIKRAFKSLIKDKRKRYEN